MYSFACGWNAVGYPEAGSEIQYITQPDLLVISFPCGCHR